MRTIPNTASPHCITVTYMHGHVQLSLSLLMYVMPIALHVMLVPLVPILIAVSRSLLYSFIILLLDFVCPQVPALLY